MSILHMPHELGSPVLGATWSRDTDRADYRKLVLSVGALVLRVVGQKRVVAGALAGAQRTGVGGFEKSLIKGIERMTFLIERVFKLE